MVVKTFKLIPLSYYNLYILMQDETRHVIRMRISSNMVKVLNFIKHRVASSKYCTI